MHYDIYITMGYTSGYAGVWLCHAELRQGVQG